MKYKTPLLPQVLFAFGIVAVLMIGSAGSSANWQPSVIDWVSLGQAIGGLTIFAAILLGLWDIFCRIQWLGMIRDARNTPVHFTYDQAREIADRQTRNEQEMLEGIKVHGMKVNDGLKGRK